MTPNPTKSCASGPLLHASAEPARWYRVLVQERARGRWQPLGDWTTSHRTADNRRMAALAHHYRAKVTMTHRNPNTEGPTP